MDDDPDKMSDAQNATAHAVSAALAAFGLPYEFAQIVRKTGRGYSGPGEVCGVAIAADGSPRVIVAHRIDGGTGHLMHIYAPKQIEAWTE